MEDNDSIGGAEAARRKVGGWSARVLALRSLSFGQNITQCSTIKNNFFIFVCKLII